MSIESKLQKLPHEFLVALLADLYERYGDIDEIIESYLEHTELESQNGGVCDTELGRQIESLTSVGQFFHYREAYALSERCECALQVSQTWQ